MIKKRYLFNTLISAYLILLGTLCDAKQSQFKHTFQQVGVATYYSDKYHGRKTASGEIYDKHKLTAVHKDYPFGTVLHVTNIKNNRSVDVIVNDRAPLKNDHLLDLSKQAAKELGFIKAGRARVKIEAIQLGSA